MFTERFVALARCFTCIPLGSNARLLAAGRFSTVLDPQSNETSLKHAQNAAVRKRKKHGVHTVSTYNIHFLLIRSLNVAASIGDDLLGDFIYFILSQPTVFEKKESEHATLMLHKNSIEASLVVRVRVVLHSNVAFITTIEPSCRKHQRSAPMLVFPPLPPSRMRKRPLQGAHRPQAT